MAQVHDCHDPLTCCAVQLSPLDAYTVTPVMDSTGNVLEPPE